MEAKFRTFYTLSDLPTIVDVEWSKNLISLLTRIHCWK